MLQRKYSAQSMPWRRFFLCTIGITASLGQPVWADGLVDQIAATSLWCLGAGLKSLANGEITNRIKKAFDPFINAVSPPYFKMSIENMNASVRAKCLIAGPRFDVWIRITNDIRVHLYHKKDGSADSVFLECNVARLQQLQDAFAEEIEFLSIERNEEEVVEHASQTPEDKIRDAFRKKLREAQQAQGESKDKQAHTPYDIMLDDAQIAAFLQVEITGNNDQGTSFMLDKTHEAASITLVPIKYIFVPSVATPALNLLMSLTIYYVVSSVTGEIFSIPVAAKLCDLCARSEYAQKLLAFQQQATIPFNQCGDFEASMGERYKHSLVKSKLYHTLSFAGWFLATMCISPPLLNYSALLVQRMKPLDALKGTGLATLVAALQNVVGKFGSNTVALKTTVIYGATAAVIATTILLTAQALGRIHAANKQHEAAHKVD